MFKGKIRFIIVGIAVVFLLICLMIILYNKNSVSVYAQTMEMTLQDFTNSDELFDSDGSMTGQDITDFANNVKSKKDGDEITDLDKVLPIQYVRYR